MRLCLPYATVATTMSQRKRGLGFVQNTREKNGRTTHPCAIRRFPGVCSSTQERKLETTSSGGTKRIACRTHSTNVQEQQPHENSYACRHAYGPGSRETTSSSSHIYGAFLKTSLLITTNPQRSGSDRGCRGDEPRTSHRPSIKAGPGCTTYSPRNRLSQRWESPGTK